MLRITTHETRSVITLQLEGRLEGPWAAELEACWRRAVGRDGGATLRVDLTCVTFIDSAGAAVLSAMDDRGAQLIAADCMTKAIVEEITAGNRQLKDKLPRHRR